MPRPLRKVEPNGIYHVWSRGNRRQDIVLDVIDRRRIEKLLTMTVAKFEVICHAWCGMTNHFHLVVQVPHANLSEALQWFKSVHAQRFNWRHGYENHLFGRRFDSRQLETDADFINTCEYVLANPAECGLVPVAEAWPWSSCAATLGLRPKPAYLTTDMLLGLLAPDERRARQVLREALAARVERAWRRAA